MVSLRQIETLEVFRLQKGWSQRQMAETLGLRPPHYTDFIKGRRSLPIGAVRKAYALGIPAQVLLTEEESDE